MSGGAFNYLFHKMEEGDGKEFACHAEEMIAEMERTIVRILAGEEIWYDRKSETYVPYPNPEHAITAIRAGIANFRAAMKLQEDLQEWLERLAPLARAIEWYCSNDTGPYDIVETAERLFYPSAE